MTLSQTRTGSIVEVEELSKTFGGLQVFEPLTLHIERNEILGLIGPNGAGKSTLINCLSGLLAPDRGLIRLSGQDVTGWSPRRLSVAGLTRTFQHSRLILERTCLDNVAVGAHRRGHVPLALGAIRWHAGRHQERHLRSIAMAALEAVGCAHLANVMAGALTAGQQRLVAVARGLATEPDVLLLDEPAAGLNETEATALGHCLSRVRSSGVTLLVVEHHLSLVLALCDRVAVLAQGRLLAIGAPDDIRADPAVHDAYMGAHGR